MQEELVSIIIPSYNTEEEILKESIASIREQTYRNLQIIIVDDGSEKPVEKILGDTGDDRIEIIRNERNRGIVFSLNRGLDRAAGTYIARMDADDIAIKDRIACQAAFLRNHPEIDIVSAFAESFGEKKVIYRSVTEDSELKAELLWKNPFIHPTVMARAQVFRDRKIRYAAEDVSEDYGLWSRLAFHEKQTFAVIPEILLYYRLHEGQLTKKKSESLRMDEEKIISESFRALGIRLTEEERKAYFSYREGESLKKTGTIKVFRAVVKICRQLPDGISRKRFRRRMFREICRHLKN